MAILLARGYVTDDALRPRRPIPPSQHDRVKPPFPLNHARILYSSIITSSDIDVINTIKPNSFERFVFTGNKSFDYSLDGEFDTVCIGGHNLDGAVITIQADDEVIDNFTVSSNDAVMRHYDNKIKAGILSVIINTELSHYIGYVSCGVALQMQRPFFSGHTPITDAHTDKYVASLTITNNVVSQGVTLMGKTTQAQWENLDDGWCREYFEPFHLSAKTMPFFFAWNLAQYPLDVGFCRVSQDTQVSYTGKRDLRSVSLQLLAV